MRKPAVVRRRSTITFIGAGALASSMATLLRRAGYSIDEIVTLADRESRRQGSVLARSIRAQQVTHANATYAADLIWLAVNDDAIGSCADALAQYGEWKNKIVLHSSGALSSDVLAPLKRRGAKVASLHPMMSFVRGEAPDLSGVYFSVEGDAAAAKVSRTIVADLGGRTFTIAKEKKPLYHAFGAFISPLLVTELTAAEEVARAAGVRPADVKAVMLPIIMRTLANYFERGGNAAFSGPLVRGDVATIQRHMRELKKTGDARDLYRALAQYAVKRLPVKNSRKLEKVLRRK